MQNPAALPRRVTIRAVRRQPCLPQFPTVLEQSLIRSGGSGLAESDTYPDARGECPDQADGPATGLDSVAGQPIDRSPLYEP